MKRFRIVNYEGMDGIHIYKDQIHLDTAKWNISYDEKTDIGVHIFVKEVTQ